MFFRKKGKYTDVDGYNRISRLIEDRQRELAHGPNEEGDFDEESVLLSREPVGRDRAGVRVQEEPAPSPPQAPARAQAMPPAPEERPPVPPPPPAPAAAPAAPAAAPSEERRIPFQPSAAETQQVPMLESAPTEVIRTPRMSVPDLGALSTQGSLVAAEAVWEGKLITDGNVRVEGTVHGEVQTAGTLFVAANAHIDGTIQARSIMLAGEIEGQVQCGERLEILPGGSARGEIVTGTLVVHEGAFIDSRFQMRRPEAPTRR